MVGRTGLPVKVVRIGKSLLSGQDLLDFWFLNTLVSSCQVDAVIDLGEIVLLLPIGDPPVVLRLHRSW